MDAARELLLRVNESKGHVHMGPILGSSSCGDLGRMAVEGQGQGRSPIRFWIRSGEA